MGWWEEGREVKLGGTSELGGAGLNDEEGWGWLSRWRRGEAGWADGGAAGKLRMEDSGRRWVTW